MKMAGKRFPPRWPPTSIRPQYEMTLIQKKRDARQALVNRFLEACRLNQPEAVEQCINKGVSAETCFPDGVQALLKAADNGYVEVIKVLLQHGEKVDTRLGQPEVPPTPVPACRRISSHPAPPFPHGALTLFPPCRLAGLAGDSRHSSRLGGRGSTCPPRRLPGTHRDSQGKPLLTRPCSNPGCATRGT